MKREMKDGHRTERDYEIMGILSDIIKSKSQKLEFRVIEFHNEGMKIELLDGEIREVKCTSTTRKIIEKRIYYLDVPMIRDAIVTIQYEKARIPWFTIGVRK